MSALSLTLFNMSKSCSFSCSIWAAVSLENKCNPLISFPLIFSNYAQLFFAFFTFFKFLISFYFTPIFNVLMRIFLVKNACNNLEISFHFPIRHLCSFIRSMSKAICTKKPIRFSPSLCLSFHFPILPKSIPSFHFIRTKKWKNFSLVIRLHCDRFFRAPDTRE